MALKTITTQDKNLQLIQDNVQTALSNIESRPFQNGVLLIGVKLQASGATAVPHKLGRTPQIWVLADQNASSTVWKSSADDKFLNLRCSANCTVSIWVA